MGEFDNDHTRWPPPCTEAACHNKQTIQSDTPTDVYFDTTSNQMGWWGGGVGGGFNSNYPYGVNGSLRFTPGPPLHMHFKNNPKRLIQFEKKFKN